MNMYTDDSRDPNKLSGVDKAAIIILTMNRENTARIFSALRENEIKELSLAMASLGNISNNVIDKVIAEFKEEITNRLTLVGNLDTTQRILESVLGKEKVAALMEDITGPIGKSTWDKLTHVNEDLLTTYLKSEYPQTIALIMSKIAPQTAAKVLSMLPEDLSFEVMMRILNMNAVKKEILERVENTLKSDFISAIHKVQKRDSHEIMAEIFNNFDRVNEARFMSILESKIPADAEKVKELMFTFDDLIKLQSSDIGILMRVIDKNKLSLALKGANETIRKLFLDNMSQRASKILLEDMEAMGPVRLKDVDEAQNNIVVALKDLIAKEEIVLSSGDAKEQFIQ